MGHNIVPNDAGWGLFGWLIAVFLLVTVVFALSLRVIIGRLRRAGKAIDKVFIDPVKPLRDDQASEMSTALAPIRVLRQALGSRKKRERDIQMKDIEPGIQD
jgi:hypothetical protein